MSLSERSERDERIAGAAFDERLRTAGAHRRLAPGPPFTGDALLGNGQFHPAGKDKTIWFFLPRGHWPLPDQKFRSFCAVRIPPALAKPGELGCCGGPVRTPACRAELDTDKSGSDGTRHSHKDLSYGRRGETKFRTKFFAKLSFKKAGGYSTVFSDSTMSSFLSFRWAPRLTSRENTVVSSTAHR